MNTGIRMCQNFYWNNINQWIIKSETIMKINKTGLIKQKPENLKNLNGHQSTKLLPKTELIQNPKITILHTHAALTLHL